MFQNGQTNTEPQEVTELTQTLTGALFDSDLVDMEDSLTLSNESSETMDLVLKTQVAPEPSKVRSSRGLLFALSARDRELFLPNRNLEEEFEGNADWLDTSEIDLEEWDAILTERAPIILVTAWDTPAFPERYARSAELQLRYLCNLTGGVNGLVPRVLLERGVLVSNWGSTISHSIAEHAMLLTLGALRNLPAWGAFMQMPSNRVTQMRTQSLRGKRVGLHGFGAVAREVVQMLRPFGARISAYSAGVPSELFRSHNVEHCHSLAELFSTNDIIIECEALTSRSRGSVTGEILDLLPTDAIFVNVGRGAVIEEKELIKRAAAGKIRLALDVFAEEPPPPHSELLRLPNALLSPHIAGPTADNFHLCGDFAMENLNCYLQGRPVQGAVTLEIFDRLA